MKLSRLLSLLLLLTGVFYTPKLHAQTYAGPVEYMNDIQKELDKVQADLWDYTNATSHNKNARKIEKKRMEIIETIKTSKANIWKLPGYKGDKALRDSAYAYLKVSYAVMTEDYSKLVDMEDVAEQSYDAMEMYILAKELAYKKQDTAAKMLQNEYRTFAAKNNVTLNEGRSKTVEKLDEAGRVYDHYNKVYLVFFKSYKQEAYVMDALNKNNVSALKQNTDALNKTTIEGMKKLDTIKSFDGDASLKTACRELIQFYKNESETKLPAISDFLVKKETFEKIKKSIEAKPAAKRTQADVDAFNTAVKDFNTSLATFNSIIQKINDERGRLLPKWNETVATFIDKHVPRN